MSYATTWPLLSTAPAAAPVDPGTVPLEVLACIRGSMWTARLNVAYGPRPFEVDNILALEYIYVYPPDEQRRMLEAYQARGYTHCCIGPINAQSYHGQYPDISFDSADTFPAYLDVLQMLWDHGLIPINFIKGDYWTLADLEAREPLFTSPRAQRLMRVVVPCGWEPARETLSGDYQDWLRWGARVFPHALRLLHMVPDHDAPGSSSEHADNADLWRAVTPLVHGWLVQSAAFADPDAPSVAAGTAFQEWLDSYDVTVKGSYPDRFVNGYAGWPGDSAWGPTTPIKIYAGEYASYWCYHDNRPEVESQAWGDAAVEVGADGYLDGGTVVVP
jgi:hypothetical protein